MSLFKFFIAHATALLLYSVSILLLRFKTVIFPVTP